jgi:predicted dehydrogenase
VDTGPTTYRIAVVGTGADPDDESTDGYAMAYRHARGYRRLSNCELVACADIVRENADAFADEFGIEDEHVYEDYERMLREVEPEIVSVCVPPGVHADIVTGCAESGVVEAVHCEKPMATTWAESKEMVAACDRRGVQLTINHQRRFATPFRAAKERVDDGTIGDLRRIEVGGPNLYDYGTHLFDMCGYVTDQTPVEWVIGQIDYRDPNMLFGVHNENQALVQWRYATGVAGLASTGHDGMVSCQLRLGGTDGVLEHGPEEGPPLRVRTDGSGWREVDTGDDGVYRRQRSRVAAAVDFVVEKTPLVTDESFSGPTYIDRAIEDGVTSLDRGPEPELAASKALDATELIFAAWESARRRGRVELPLDIKDNPLDAMVRNGVLGVSPSDR